MRNGNKNEYHRYTTSMILQDYFDNVTNPVREISMTDYLAKHYQRQARV